MVTVEQILELWAQADVAAAKDYCLDVSHPLGVFSSVDGSRPAFLIVSPIDPREFIAFDVDAIDLEITRRDWDMKWVCYFTLLNPRLDVAFAELVSSLVNGSRGAATPQDAMRVVGQSFQELQLLFAIAPHRKPNLQEIRGLFAELWFLANYLAPVIGIQAAVEAWKGPLGATHDFDLYDSRFLEIKSRRWISSKVHISSPAQLSIEHGELTLAIAAFDDSIEAESNSVSDLFGEITAATDSTAATIALFMARLGAAGIDSGDEVYKTTRFTTPAIRTYSVTEDFPKLRLDDIPIGISNISYQLDTDHLSVYEAVWPGENYGH